MSALFSTQGRLGRSRFWLTALGSTLCLSLALGAILFGLWQVMPGEINDKGGYEVNGAMALPYILAVFGYVVLQVWIGIGIGVRRYHDMDKPGTRMLVLLIPFVGGIIYFFQAGFGRGTPGANRYGADPRAAA